MQLRKHKLIYLTFSRENASESKAIKHNKTDCYEARYATLIIRFVHSLKFHLPSS